MPAYLLELRKRGLSLRAFARRVGLSPEWISKVFNGEVEPSGATERKIKEALEHCPWCGNEWPEDLPIEGEPSHKRESTARRVSG